MSIQGWVALVLAVSSLAVGIYGLGEDWPVGVLILFAVAACALLIAGVLRPLMSRRGHSSQDPSGQPSVNAAQVREWLRPGNFVSFTDCCFDMNGDGDGRAVTAVAEVNSIGDDVGLEWRDRPSDGLPNSIPINSLEKQHSGLRTQPGGGVVGGRGWRAHSESPADLASWVGYRYRDLDSGADRDRFVDRANRWAEGRPHR